MTSCISLVGVFRKYEEVKAQLSYCSRYRHCPLPILVRERLHARENQQLEGPVYSLSSGGGSLRLPIRVICVGNIHSEDVEKYEVVKKLLFQFAKKAEIQDAVE